MQGQGSGAPSSSLALWTESRRFTCNAACWCMVYGITPLFALQVGLKPSACRVGSRGVVEVDCSVATVGPMAGCVQVRADGQCSYHHDVVVDGFLCSSVAVRHVSTTSLGLRAGAWVPPWPGGAQKAGRVGPTNGVGPPNGVGDGRAHKCPWTLGV